MGIAYSPQQTNAFDKVSITAINDLIANHQIYLWID